MRALTFDLPCDRDGSPPRGYRAEKAVPRCRYLFSGQQQVRVSTGKTPSAREGWRDCNGALIDSRGTRVCDLQLLRLVYQVSNSVSNIDCAEHDITQISSTQVSKNAIPLQGGSPIHTCTHTRIYMIVHV